MKENSIKNSNSKILIICSFLFCFFFTIIIELIYHDRPWTCDAWDYWNRGELLQEGGLDFHNFDGFRGYIFPLFLGMCNCLGGKACWFVFNAAIASIYSVLIVYGIESDSFNFDKYSFLKVIAFHTVLTMLFVGLYVYPLSDLFAVILMTSAALCCRKSFDVNLKIGKLMLIYLMGVFAYLAYNTRTIYLFAGIALAIIYIMTTFVRIIKENNDKIKTLISLLINFLISVLGVITSAIPQIIINMSQSGKFSISVPTSQLMLNQVLWGIKWQRYDTYIPLVVDEAHPAPQVIFVDNVGISILEDMNIVTFENWGDYFEIFLSYPVEVITIYTKHFINYIFPCFPEVYITDLNSPKFILGIVGFSIFFLTALILIRKCCKSYKNILYYIPVIVPGLLIIPGAVEYRFSLPLYVFVLSQLCFNTDWKKLKQEFLSHKWTISLIYLAMGLMCFIIWSNMLASESVTPLRF